MLRKFIGSSNVYRTYNSTDFTEYPKFEMVGCTSKEVFATALDGIGPENGEVIISVIENLLCDAVRNLEDPDAVNSALEKTIKENLEMIESAANKKPDVKFALAQPTLRPAHQWFTDGHEAFCRRLSDGIRTMDKTNVGKIDGPIKMSQVFDHDGIHLTRSSGKVFVNALLFNASSFFTAEIVNLEDEMETETAKSVHEKRHKQNNNLANEIAELKDDINRRRIDDSLVTARIREELDFLSNTRKEDRIILTGLTSRVPIPVAELEKKKWIKDLVGDILNQVEAGSAERMLNVIQGWKGKNIIPLVEVRMENAEVAQKIRKQFAAKKKAGQNFGKVYLSNSVTLGTRVRIEIMKAMAKCFANEKEIMYVSSFSSRPMLHLRPKDSGSRTMAFNFGDALTRYGMQMRQGDLGEAYRRAGVSFQGQMQQNFVVLYDTRPPSVAPWIRKPAGRGMGGGEAKRKLVNGGDGDVTGTPEKRKK
jgi:hypothetical protein